VVALTQGLQQGQDAVKQTNVVLVGQVVVAVTCAKLRVLVGGHVRGRMGQGRQQGHANHIGGGLVVGHGATDIAHGFLNAAGDDAGRVEQRAVPIEGDQVKLPGAVAGHGL
jgi:hypothetical protein